MSRARKIVLIAASALTVLSVILLIAGIVIVQTDWFRNMVRTKIVAAVEDATGGKAEIGSFAFDWHRLRADVRDFVIHGLEPPGAAPLVRAKLVEVDLKLLSPFKGFVDIASLLIDTPQANIIVYPDGHTNIPAPKLQHSSNKTGIETIVDMAIGHFELRNASVTFGDRKSDVNVSGENFRAQLGYNPLSPRYTGEIDMSPMYLKAGREAPWKVDIKLPVTLEKDKVTLANAELTTPQSKIVVSGSMDHLSGPAHIRSRRRPVIALEEARRAGALSLPLDTNAMARRSDPCQTSPHPSTIKNPASGCTAPESISGKHRSRTSGTPNAVQFNASLAMWEKSAGCCASPPSPKVRPASAAMPHWGRITTTVSPPT